MEKFKFRKGKYEVRSCDENLLSDSEKKHTRIDLVEWTQNDASCFSLGWFYPDKEGFCLKFIVDRIKDKDWQILSELINKAIEKIELEENKND